MAFPIRLSKLFLPGCCRPHTQCMTHSPHPEVSGLTSEIFPDQYTSPSEKKEKESGERMSKFAVPVLRAEHDRPHPNCRADQDEDVQP